MTVIFFFPVTLTASTDVFFLLVEESGVDLVSFEYRSGLARFLPDEEEDPREEEEEDPDEDEREEEEEDPDEDEPEEEDSREESDNLDTISRRFSELRQYPLLPGKVRRKHLIFSAKVYEFLLLVELMTFAARR